MYPQGVKYIGILIALSEWETSAVIKDKQRYWRNMSQILLASQKRIPKDSQCKTQSDSGELCKLPTLWQKKKCYPLILIQTEHQCQRWF